VQDSSGDVARPTIVELSREECEAILARNCVGRIAFSLYDAVYIKPLHYVYQQGAIWARTSDGLMTGVTGRNQRVGFEVDEVTDIFHWCSVVVQGEVELLSADGDAAQRLHWEQGIRLLRSLVPATLTESDPVPDRHRLFRISADHLTGRRSSVAAGQ
jgi:uncharacterized protein